MEELRRNNILLEILFHQDFVNEIMKIPLAQTNFRNQDDKIMWVNHVPGKFLVKSAYAAITMNPESQQQHHTWAI